MRPSARAAVDTSVVVAAFASWHEHHDVARAAIDRGPHLIEHCALECYSVLTRLPFPHRSPPELVLEFLLARFPGGWLKMEATGYRRFLRGLAQNGVTGGAAYDALIAATATHCKVELISCDQRARATYARYGVEAHFPS